MHVLLLLGLLQAVLLMLGDGGDSLNVLLYADHHQGGLGDGAGVAASFLGPELVLGILCQVLFRSPGAGPPVPGLVLVFMLFSVSLA